MSSTPTNDVETSVEMLVAELDNTRTDDVVDGFVADVLDAVGDSTHEFDRELIVADLVPLVLLIASVEGPVAGADVQQTLHTAFDTEVSPGTVYPTLHDLNAAGILDQRALVQSKQYHVADDDTVRDRLTARMRQHLVLAACYQAAVTADTETE